ncbi:hypothetical protein Cenrod_1957 [Candidatus Symbiobacter mobilis CR]|uniref:Plasmid stabilization system protein n=2 Tax=Candidatus Symbiobacter TaxID=1436289 RepID=U5NCR9_9BURK|nr:hypothetical protein Cenrod_1957 [Candidatus Symbiobacter mobilis CR]
MKVVFRPEAEQELLEAQNWYEACAVGLGFEFARAVDAAISKMQRMPLAFPRIEGEFRHILTRKFPYSIIYHASSTEIIVVSVFHHRRKPKVWLQHTKG